MSTLRGLGLAGLLAAPLVACNGEADRRTAHPTPVAVSVPPANTAKAATTAATSNAPAHSKAGGCFDLCAMSPDHVGNDDRLASTVLHAGTRIADLGAKGIVVSLLAPFSAPAHESLASLVELARDPPHEELALFAVIAASESDTSAKVMIDVATKGDVPEGLTVIFDADESIAKAFGTTKFPETFVLDGTGALRARFDGSRVWTATFARSMLRATAANQHCSFAFDTSDGASTNRCVGASICSDGRRRFEALVAQKRSGAWSPREKANGEALALMLTRCDAAGHVR